MRDSRRAAVFLAVAGLVSAVLPAAFAGERGEAILELGRKLVAADAALAQGRPAEAEPIYEEVLRLAEQRKAALLVARATDGLADACREQGRFDRATELYGRSIPMWEGLFGPDQPRVATSLHNLGTIRLKQGRPDLAAPAFGRALAIWTAALGEDSPEARSARRGNELATRELQAPEAINDVAR